MADDVEVRFGASLEGLQAGIGEAKSLLESLTAPVQGLMETFGALGEAAAAAFAVEEIHRFAEGMADLGEQTERAAAILGVPTQEIGALRLVAQTSGLSLEQLEMSFGRLSRAVTDQTPTAKRALDALGLSFADLKGQDAESTLRILATAFSGINDGATKDAIAIDLFGRAGMNMIPMLDKGASAIDSWAEVAERMGVALRENVVARMMETHDALITLGAAIEGSGIAVFMKFSGVINGAVQFMSNLAAEFTRSAAQSGVVAVGLDLIRTALQAVEVALVLGVHGFQEIWLAGVQGGEQILITFRTMGTVIADIFTGLVGGIEAFFSGLVTAGSAATKAVGQQFSDLGAVIKGALTGNAGEAWDKMKADASSAGEAIKSAMSGAVSGFSFADAKNEELKGQVESEQSWARYTQDVARINREGQAELKTIFSDGTTQLKAEVDKRNAILAPLPNKDAQKAAKDALDATMVGLNGEIKAYEDAASQREKILDDDLSHHRISIASWLSESEAALQTELTQVRSVYDQELQLAGLTATQIASIKEREREAVAKITDQMAADQRKAADATLKDWTDIANSIEGAFNSQLRGLLAGTTSWATAMKNIAADLVIKFIEAGEKIVVNWIVGEATKTAATTTGAATRSAAEAASGAASIAGNIGNILSAIFADAARVFAGVFAFLAPALGPAAAGPAAASQASVLAAAGGLALYDIGAFSIPNDQLAMVHKNELIMPAAEAGAFRGMLSGAARDGGQGGQGGQGGGKSVTVAPQFNIRGMGTADIAAALMNNRGDVTKAVTAAIRDGAHLASRRGVRFA